MKKSLMLIVVVAALGGVLLFQHYGAKENTEQTKPAGPDAKVLAVLQQADAACKAFTSGSFRAEHRGEGVMAKRNPPVKGSVQFDSGKEWVRASVTMNQPDGSERSFDVSTDGEKVVSVDHLGKNYHVGAYPFARFLLSPGLGLVMPKFGNEVPFKTELERNAKHEGVQTEAGTPCDVIVVGTSGEATRWYIGQSDHLPRRVDHIVNLWVNKEGGDKTILTLTDIKPATFVQADFQIAAPEGYAENKIAEPEPLLAVGTPAPDWELKTPQGQAVRLSQLRGNVVVLDFWATWCGPCKMAMPKIQELHAEYEGRPVKVFGVNCQEDAHGDPDAYMRSKGYTYGPLMEGDAVSKAYHVPGLPTFYVIDAKGVIVYSSIGAGEEAKIKEAVKKAVEETST